MNRQNYEEISTKSKKCCNIRNKNCIKMLMLSVCALVVGIIIGIFIPRRNVFPDNSNNYQFSEMSDNLQHKVSEFFLLNQLKIYASEIHQAGSLRNLQLAEIMENNWKIWGLQSVKRYKYQINKTVVNQNNPSIIRLWFRDKIIFNATTVELNGTLPLYHSYSINGSAKGKFVFINYGLPTDLLVLDNLNISYCGFNVIVITRLGFSVRSAKMKTVMKKCGKNLPGAILVYPDPWDFAVDPNNKSSNPDNTPVYPNSWWLPGDAGVFGNFKMLSDLQNPELPSLDGIFETVNFSSMQTPIPAQPISYNDARALFKYMTNGSVPKSWQNCLPQYLQSANDYELEIIVNNEVQEVTFANVVGMIPGFPDTDRYVILGNHRDAWATGASDPVSGTIILQQVASILGNAYKRGKFRPFRTLIFTNWDGEEEGLIGSNEFTNQFASDLLERCVAYVNMDCPIKGSWSFNGRATPLMVEPMLKSSARVWINSSTTLYQDWLKKMPNSANESEPRVNFLGGGSDHIPFAYVLGIPSAYPEYKYNQSLANMPAYHTKYDNIDMMLKYIDPQLVHHQTISKFVIDYMIRLSYSPIIPYSIDRLVSLMLQGFDDLQKKMDAIPFIKLSNYSDIVKSQLILLDSASKSFTELINSKKNLFNDFLLLRKLNDILLNFPRMFLTREGLPTRPYLRNILLSTKLKNSYLGSVFTGVYDAIDLYEAKRIKFVVVLRQLSLLFDSLRKATDLLNGGLVGKID